MMNLLRANRVGKRWARASAVGASALLIALCLEVTGFSSQVSQADRSAEFQQFVGTWQAKFKGKVFQTIKLEKNQDKLTGTVSFHVDITVDPKSGELTDVVVRDDGSDPIVETELTDGALLITEEEIQFKMKVTGPDEADLQIVVPPDPEEEEKAPAAKPWKLKRVKRSPEQS
jgi:hypothetical protein